MASTSSSSIQKSFKYDVFLSFRGEDTRKNFVDNLYHALKQRGIYTYKDDEEIRKGKAISDELIRSIEDSRIYVIVFSKNYASSSWCLNELVKIMECHKMNGQIAYPIFYDVEPTEVRNQIGVVGEAFAKHVNEEAAERWRDALKEAASLAGRELKNTFDGHEAKFIQKIVEEISKELRLINCSGDDGKLVGMKKRVKHVVSSLRIDICEVRMIGIKGMGGAGKTTLARAVFDQISSQFEGSSFVENVRENSKNPMCGLKALQRQVLSDVLNKQDITINGVFGGTNMMKQRICGKKVLLVLDDVDDTDQLKALAGDPSWFKPGSRVIITTRDEQVLVAHGLSVNMILDVNLLSDEEANCLFNRYAFGREIPNPGFEVLSVQGVSYAACLPLTIKVLGSSLRGQDESVWKDALDRLKTIPLKGTLEILELSYDGLENDYKEMFLNVACILKGWKKERAIRVLESCDLHAISGLRVLEQKSLITLSNGYLDMHDSIVEMGKNIVRRSHPDKPYKHSRLWIKKEIEDILVEDKGTKATRYIKLRTVDQDIVMKDLRKMRELRYLEVHGSGKYYDNLDNIDVDSLHLPDSLRYLHWHDYPFTCLPKTFSAKNLVGLEMRYSKIDQLWKGGEKEVLPTKLRFINLDNCGYLKTWDFGLTKNLERLRLWDCLKLAELHVPIESCKLKCLEIIYCPLIRTLDLKLAHNLDTLTVEHCRGLVEVHMPIKSCKLQYLHIFYCDLIQTLDLERAHNLDTLTVERCWALVEVHMPIESRKLKYLRIVDCDLIQTLDLERAHNLDTLTVTSCRAMVEIRLPTELKHPIVDNCSMLKNIYRIPNSDTNTLNLVSEHVVDPHMPVENPKPKSINLYCSNLRTLDLGWWGVLDKLNIDKHETLVQLQLSFVKIRELSLRQCSKLKTMTLTETISLNKLYLEECRDLVKVHMPNESPQLKIIKIHCSKLITLDLTRTWNLEKLQLFQCEDLVKLPIGSSELKIVEIHSSELIRTLDLTLARNLEKLHLIKCEDLLELHMPIESPKLKSIIIRRSKMRTLYLGLSPCLEHLDLSDCCNLVEIHAPVDCLSGSFRFKPCIVNQGFPMDGSFAELHLTSGSLGICPLHPDNNFPKFHFECVYNRIPLSFTQNLVKLISLGLCGCTNLANLSKIICGLQLRKLTLEGSIPEAPKELDQLESLEELSFLSTKIEHVPDNLFRLQHLKVLRFKSCWFLKQLPEDIGRLECLEELHVTDCTSLRDIPNSICEMKRLKCFHLTNCILVEKLPKEMGRLKCLKELSTQGTGIRDFPPSIFELEDLLFLL